ncbi:DUF4259 domain-containing protein [Clostridium felsineum]|uniref:DUF4259 domain-containing protein n=1 Tax=Clostridium felsineum TaxID=36839 RepID=UPI0009C5AADA|nr:DUF4259 domain-containing protein [Clostridium felsineum]URZ04116.1 hypothetical protein CLAUR_042040 [Clostridium felsineum]
MGTFGNEIFEDDLALDIKYSFEEMLNSKVEINELIDNVMLEFEDSFEDFDEAMTAVLALATLVVENGFKSQKLKNELDKVVEESEYLEGLKEENLELYESRLELIKKLKINL